MAAAQETGNFSEAYPMKGGDSPNGYANNSTHQRGVVDAAKELINTAVAEKLDIGILLSSHTFRIADLGCSVGPNTFFSVDNILEAVEFKYQGQGLHSQIPEFQVFFNDHIQNDFNMLFKSLPQNRRYSAAGVPGSFYGPIFPNASLHFVHSSYALHWLSSVPKAVVDKNSPAWNKGRIQYSNSTDEVIRAYEAQYAKDIECFLNARAQEMVHGGFMVLVIPGRSNGTPHYHAFHNMNFQLLESSLMEMAKKGVVEEEKVDSFNIPVYSMTPQELEAAAERNGCYSVMRMENLPYVSTFCSYVSKGQIFASHMRAVTEGLIKQHFGDEILDELFDLYSKKVDDQPPSFFESRKDNNFFALLKRKAN